MFKRTQFTPRTLIFAALVLALVVVLCGCGSECESTTAQGHCCNSGAHGTLSCEI